ncbi:hypothetical protein [Streptomyces sp. NPDC058401]|uniref:hypothetical protein n=1 Tax=Streptomyces sp. NPDC058401 TaxID=3346480 RepID=UPI003659384B
MTASRTHLVRCAALGLAATALLLTTGAVHAPAGRTAGAAASLRAAGEPTPDDFIWLLPAKEHNGPRDAGSARV